MREYRGRREDTKEWVYGYLFVTVEEVGAPHSINRICYNIVVDKTVKYYVKYDTIGQFTGIYDKNKVKVFEKDRVLFQGKEYEVKYFEDFAMYGLVGKSAYRPFNENEPMGSGGSSTSYKPYILNKYYQSRIEVIKNEN